MAKVSGPFMSLTASGTLGKTITAASWKGVQYMRKWFMPEDPGLPQQVNQRLALKLALNYLLVTKIADKPDWDEAAEGMAMSGTNLFMKKCLLAWREQFTADDVPASVTYTGDIPDVVFTWVKVT